MKKYTIYCTEEQTRKALALGAPIERQSPESNAPIASYGEEQNEFGKKGPKLWNCPTAEQMIRWLEEQYPIKEVSVFRYRSLTRGTLEWSFDFYDGNENILSSYYEGVESREEATMIAIDSALQFLMDNRKQ